MTVAIVDFCLAHPQGHKAFVDPNREFNQLSHYHILDGEANPMYSTGPCIAQARLTPGERFW